MGMDYIRKTYKVPAKRGARVSYMGGDDAREGTIVGSDGSYLCVLLDGEEVSRRFHPVWEIRYLP